MSALDVRENIESPEGGPSGSDIPSAGPRFLPAGVPAWEVAAFVLMMLAVGMAHGWNMFHFPYYENDEGTYMSQAQALVDHGQLAPYTYWYDHAPGGWILIGLWTKLTGGFNTFGFSINSGRVLMLVLHLSSSVLLYLIVRKTTRRPVAALIAVAVFSFGGNGIYFQRRVLLDNIAVFWIFACIAALVFARGRLSRISLAGLFVGMALLTKETMAFVAPVLLAAAIFAVPRGRRTFAGVLFAGTASILLACYALLAVLKGELFPTGTLLGGDAPHVSLLGTLQWQGSRPGGPLWSPDSTIRYCLAYWHANDRIWIPLAVGFSVVVVLLAIVRPKVRLAAGLVLAYWLYLLRGGMVAPFYAAPLYAVVGLASGMVAGLILPSPWQKFDGLRRGLMGVGMAVLSAVIAWSFLTSSANQVGLTLVKGPEEGESHLLIEETGQSLFTSDQTSPQLRAVDWILGRADAGTVAIDNYAYLELHGNGAPSELQAEYYWKLDLDPQVRRESAGGDPYNIDYLLVTPQMEYDLGGLPFTRAAFESSRVIESFEGDGYRVQVRETMTPRRIFDSE